MSGELLPCPFCDCKAVEVTSDGSIVCCGNIECFMADHYVRRNYWQTRTPPSGVNVKITGFKKGKPSVCDETEQPPSGVGFLIDLEKVIEDLKRVGHHTVDEELWRIEQFHSKHKERHGKDK